MFNLIFSPITFFVLAGLLFALTIRNRYKARSGNRGGYTSVTLSESASQAEIFEFLQYAIREIELSKKASSISVAVYPHVESHLARINLPTFILHSIAANRSDLIQGIGSISSSNTPKMPSRDSFTRVAISSGGISDISQHLSKHEPSIDSQTSINLELSKLDANSIMQNSLSTARLWLSSESKATPILFNLEDLSRLSVMHEVLQMGRQPKSGTPARPEPVTTNTAGVNLGQIILFASGRQDDGSVVSFGVKRSDKDQGLTIVSDDSELSADIVLMNIVTDIHHSLPILCIARQADLANRIIEHIPKERLNDIIWWSDTAAFGFGYKLDTSEAGDELMSQLAGAGFNTSLLAPSGNYRTIPIRSIAGYIRNPIIIIDISHTEYDMGAGIFLEWVSSELADAIHRLDLAQNTQIYCSTSHNNQRIEPSAWVKPLEIIAHKVYGASLTTAIDFQDYDNSHSIIMPSQTMVYGPRRSTADLNSGLISINSLDLRRLRDGELLLQGNGHHSQSIIKGRVLDIN